VAVDFELVAQEIVYTALDGHISANVYDDAPFLPEGMPVADFPYVVVGNDTMAPFDDDSNVGANITITLHIWSRYQGFKETKRIMGEVREILNRATLSKVGYCVIDSLQEFSDASIDPDGKTRHGVMRFRLTIQEV